MKKALFLLIVGAAAGAYGFYYVQQKNLEAAKASESTAAEKSAKPAPTLGDRVRDEAKTVKDSVTNKLTEWHLTPEAIGEELERTGQVVRNKAQSTGDSIANASSSARIVTVIKTKLTLDKELSSRAISIDCDNGQVTLNGTVASNALIAKAVGIALETDGVTRVKSLLKVTPPEKK